MRTETRNNERCDDDSSKCPSTGPISFECHDSLFSEELILLADMKIQAENQTEFADRSKTDGESVNDIINREITTTSTFYQGTTSRDRAHTIPSNDSSLSLTSITEDAEPKEQSLIRKFQRNMIDKHMRTGRLALRSVVSSPEAHVLACHMGQEQEHTQTGTRQIRTVASFNSAWPSSAIDEAPTTSIPIGGGDSANAPLYTKTANSNSNRLFQVGDEATVNTAAVSAGRRLLAAPSTTHTRPRNPSAQQRPSALVSTNSNPFKQSVEDFIAVVGCPGFPQVGGE